MPNIPHCSLEEYSDKTALLHRFLTLEDSERKNLLGMVPPQTPYIRCWDVMILYGGACTGAVNIPWEVVKNTTVDNLVVVIHPGYGDFRHETFGTPTRKRYLFLCHTKSTAFALNKQFNGVVVEFLPHSSTFKYAADEVGGMG